MEQLGKKTAWSFFLFAIVWCILFLWIDKPITLFLYAHESAKFTTVNSSISSLAQGVVWKSLFAIASIVIFYHDYRYGQTRWSRELFYILLTVMLATLVGDALKFLLGRYRPIELFSQGQYGLSFLTDAWQQNSTPSGHTYRIFSLMTALGLVWSRFRWFFLAIAIIVAMSRVLVLDHYLSDIVFGAYLGILSAIWARWYLFVLRRKEV